MRRRLLIALTLALTLSCATAVAYLTTSGGGSAAASVGTLSAPAVSVPGTSTGSVAVSWSAAHVTPAGPALDALVTYLVERSSTGGLTWSSTGGTCGTLSAPATSCTDAVAASGTYLYRVTARFRSWTAAGISTGVVVSTLTAPSITGKPSSPSATTAPTFSFTGGGGTGYECQLDGGGYSACTSPKSYLALATGAHTFNVRATDGTSTGPAAAHSWTIVTAAPTIGAKPSNPSANASTATIAFSHASYSSFQCKLDAGAFTSCTSPANLKTLNGNVNLADGGHTFTVQALDADGAATSQASTTWTVTSTAPAIGAKPSNPSANASTATIAFSHATYSSFQCKLDAGAFTSCTSPANLKTLNGNVNLADGSHTFTVQALDADGAATSQGTSTWTVATAAPSITSGPANPTSSTSATFAFSHSAAFPSYECQIDGGAFSACTSPKTYTGLSVASHTFGVRAIDADGTRTATATSTWTIATAPVITITSCTGGSGHRNAIAGTTTVNTGTVTVKIFAGTGIGGTLAATLTTTTFGGSSPSFTWSTTTANNQLTAGSTYPAQATQVSGAGLTSNQPTCTFTAN